MVVRALQAFQRCEAVSSLVLVLAPGRVAQARALLEPYRLSKLRQVCAGGDERGQSVRAGLQALPEEADLVAIHDGARPLITPALIQRVIASAAQHGAALPCLPVQETVKQGHGGRVTSTLDRDQLFLAQTPQAFAVELIRRAHAQRPALPATDDAQLVERLGHKVEMVAGDPENIKITTSGDLLLAESLLQRPSARQTGAAEEEGEMTQPLFRTGFGHDAHRLVPHRKLILGGVELQHVTGLLGHSDADVLTHAVIDALLGAAALGDLGTHFPDHDPRYKDAHSLELLSHASDLVRQAGYHISNIDVTVVCEAPQLSPHVEAMQDNLGRSLGLGAGRISVKATTTEGLGFAGRGEGIAAHAVALLMARANP